MSLSHRSIPTRVGHLAVVDEGAGAPVVLWPSLFADHRMFDLVCAALGPGWRTIRIDGPGFGRSDPPDRELGTDELADAVVEVMDALALARASFAGCSWGGQIGVQLAARAPDRLVHVVIMNTPLGPSLGGHRGELFGTRWLLRRRVFAAGVARAMFAPDSRARHPERVAAFVAAFRDFVPAAAARTVRTVLTRSAGLDEVLPRVAAPMTILLGEADALYPAAELGPRAARAPGARVRVVPGCGHLAPLEAPDEVAAAIRAGAAVAAS